MDPLSLSCLVELLTTLGMIRYQSLTNSDDDRLWVELTSEPRSWTSFSDHSSVSSAAHRRGMNRTARLDTRSQAQHVPATFVFSILDVDITIKYFIMFHVYFILRGAGVAICLERSADLHMAQLMPLPLTVSCFSKIQIGFTFLVLAHPGNPGKRAVKHARVCVCVGKRAVKRARACVRACMHACVYILSVVCTSVLKYNTCSKWMWHMVAFHDTVCDASYVAACMPHYACMRQTCIELVGRDWLQHLCLVNIVACTIHCKLLATDCLQICREIK